MDSRQRHIRQQGLLDSRVLRDARVLVIGAGGLGSPLLYYLAAAGVGSIVVCDGDRVSLSDLNRQILYAAGDVGRSKAEAAVERLRALDGSLALRAEPVYFTVRPPPACCRAVPWSPWRPTGGRYGGWQTACAWPGGSPSRTPGSPAGAATPWE